MTLYLPLGPPASGKSTVAHDCVRAGLFGSDAIICPDVLRWKLTGDMSDQSENAAVFAMVDTLVSGRLNRGLPVWLDATNCSTKVSPFNPKWAASGAELVVIYFDTPLAVCLDRNERRGRHVPTDIIERMHDDAATVWRWTKRPSFSTWIKADAFAAALTPEPEPAAA